MMNRTAAEVWQGFVGSQTPAEFREISRQQGHATIDQAVAAYVAEIPNMCGQSYSDEELQEIGELLGAYISDHAA